MHHLCGMMVRSVADAVEHGITQPDIRRVDIDLCPQCPCAVRKFAGFHSFKQVAIFRNGAIAKSAFFSETTKLVGLFRRHVIDISFAFVDQLERELVKPVEVTEVCARRRFLSAQSSMSQYIRHDGIDIPVSSLVGLCRPSECCRCC